MNSVMTKTQRVELIIAAEWPDKTPFVVLQRNGEHTIGPRNEKVRLKWPGGTFALCHGTFPDVPNFDGLAALKSLIVPNFGEWVSTFMVGLLPSNLCVINASESAEEDVTTYCLRINFVPDTFTQYLTLRSRTGGLKFVDESTTIVDLSTMDEELGYDSMNGAAMMPHLIESVRRALQLVKNTVKV